VSFLLPIAGLLGLLALPIVGFYLLKTRRRERLASTLLFWDALKPRVENSPMWRKLRKILSLLLQLLALLFLILALARLAFDWEKQQPQRTVLVLDPSASMQAMVGGESRWQAIKEMAQSRIGKLRIEDELAILQSGTEPEVLSGWSSSKRLLRRALDTATFSGISTDPRPTLELAAELAAMRDNAQVVFLSDGVWPQPAGKGLAQTFEVVRPDQEEPLNAGITFFAVRRLQGASGGWQLDINVSWRGPLPYSGTLTLQRDGNLMDALPLTLQPGEDFQHSWTGSDVEAVSFQASLEFPEGDQLSGDNLAEATLPALKPVRVLLVSESAPYLEAALASTPNVTWQRVSSLSDGPNPEADLVIFNRKTPPPEPMSAAVVMIGPEEDGYWGTYDGSFENVIVSEIKNTDPILRHTRLRQVAIDSAGDWSPPPGIDILARSLERPVLFGRWDGDSPWLLIGFDPRASDFPLRTAFPILISNLIQSLRLDKEVTTEVAPLPGAVESQLTSKSQDPAEATDASSAGFLQFPGWWLALLLAVILLTTEWALYSRRVTE